MSRENCTCGRIAVGMQVTENRNWHDDCPAHGVGTEWYKAEGKAYFTEQSRKAVEAQQRARKARENYRRMNG